MSGKFLWDGKPIYLLRNSKTYDGKEIFKSGAIERRGPIPKRPPTQDTFPVPQVSGLVKFM